MLAARIDDHGPIFDEQFRTGVRRGVHIAHHEGTRRVVDQLAAELPAFTQMIVNASDWMQKYALLMVIGIAGFIYWIIWLKKKSRKFNPFMDRASLKLPVIGNILNNSAIARFARTLATTFAAGVPLVDALETVAGATGNVVYGEAILKIREDVSVGHQLQLAMSQVNVFPHMVIQMTAIGEEAGSLDTMLNKVAEFYENEVNNDVDALSSLLEPFIMIIIGTVVGGMIVGMYLPIFKLAAVM